MVHSRVILFGATGYTGRLTARAMVRAGLAPVLVGRDPNRVASLVDDLTPLAPGGALPTWVQADATAAPSVRALVKSPQDVLVSTVGPFLALGTSAVEAAIQAGATYIDSTGESPFIRWVFENAGPRAERSGARLLTAFGYDYVPGNLAGALAVRDAREAGCVPDRVEIGYFVSGGMGMSSGTRASMAGVMLEPTHSFSSGAVCSERAGARVRDFQTGRGRRDGLSVGGSEQFTLPRLDSDIREVGVYLGWAGRWTKVASSAGRAMDGLVRLPGVRGLLTRALAADGTTGQGPTADERSTSRTIVVARALDASGKQVSSVRLNGPTPYELTADLLTWGADTCRSFAIDRGGAYGPVDAFGLDDVIRGCAEIGLARED